MKKNRISRNYRIILSIARIWVVPFISLFFWANSAHAQTAMVNVQSRNPTNLNGNWQVIIDPTGIGDWKQVWQERKPQSKTDFIEYSFEGGPVLKVPGCFNSQMCELTYFEGTVWYKKQFNYSISDGKRLFLHFGAVNYIAEVYLNGQKLGSHEGGFTPFQFEITGKIKEGENSLVVKADNRRVKNGLPGTGYDWFNYGGITRDVELIETGNTCIGDYFIQLKKGSLDTVLGWVQLNGTRSKQDVEIEIPELKLRYKTKTNDDGLARVEFKSESQLWSPGNPKLYQVTVKSNTDFIADTIGFRSIEVQGNQVLLNRKPIFLKAVNIHEENPYRKARAYSTEDVRVLLDAAKELGCNLVRLAHYPHSENMVKEAERMGLMVWDELPVYQHIQFSDSLIPAKLEQMLHEMVGRDKNRCGVVVWSLSNETYPGTPNRNEALIEMTQKCHALDSTRLITHVINTQSYRDNTFDVWDPLYKYSDLVTVNEYIGWYIPWQGKPSETKWNIAFSDKPVFISEFGGEALYGNKNVPTDEACFWSEEYQEQIYKDQTEMFATIPNLCGVCPWLLFDYRSLGRMNQVYQNGYNRKGLMSENGEKKKAWYIIHEYYKKK
ncbi:MAG: glycoside hydrolase family 2 [Bacteroidetes bacterium GWE2_40_63]|nr:MAG: glycoside hydrolase family 2 [Bacteroidetes bacterium GWA2_40_14]OFX64707.1 MAG: glycoside hydrolase family 2 [Bacteroidetes bacterium GWC2_40_13]OFX73641.1 MAG: glycoside hydrolase family 2 [Bacteroidetes bacterium GWD2_40_43]OFX88504.1 MAG: glycoside hydrolase family 2 [Bacteroidetes bacterium GWE2_40_63]OFY22657.1 MAG: glycoside hydrolase family 2 [Bacteroidetes bacterium GWF2_40_13]OFZ25335.1 MAG: glycoside hydrolase family 2 [Bacteroidetes bacterium RIFOXYC2_FULL_40_12]